MLPLRTAPFFGAKSAEKRRTPKSVFFVFCVFCAAWASIFRRKLFVLQNLFLPRKTSECLTRQPAEDQAWPAKVLPRNTAARACTAEGTGLQHVSPPRYRGGIEPPKRPETNAQAMSPVPNGAFGPQTVSPHVTVFGVEKRKRIGKAKSEIRLAPDQSLIGAWGLARACFFCHTRALGH